MNRAYKTAEKAIKVIRSCGDLKYVPIMDSYIDLATHQILKRKTTKNYGYATKVLRAAHYQTQNLIKYSIIKTLFNQERRLSNDKTGS